MSAILPPPTVSSVEKTHSPTSRPNDGYPISSSQSAQYAESIVLAQNLLRQNQSERCSDTESTSDIVTILATAPWHTCVEGLLVVIEGMTRQLAAHAELAAQLKIAQSNLTLAETHSEYLEDKLKRLMASSRRDSKFGSPNPSKQSSESNRVEVLQELKAASPLAEETPMLSRSNTDISSSDVPSTSVATTTRSFFGLKRKQSVVMSPPKPAPAATPPVPPIPPLNRYSTTPHIPKHTTSSSLGDLPSVKSSPEYVTLQITVTTLEDKLSTSERNNEELKTKVGELEKTVDKLMDELEKLSVELFEEANKMVADARKDKDKVERELDDTKKELQDTKKLLEAEADTEPEEAASNPEIILDTTPVESEEQGDSNKDLDSAAMAIQPSSSSSLVPSTIDSSRSPSPSTSSTSRSRWFGFLKSKPSETSSTEAESTKTPDPNPLAETDATDKNSDSEIGNGNAPTPRNSSFQATLGLPDINRRAHESSVTSNDTFVTSVSATQVDAFPDPDKQEIIHTASVPLIPQLPSGSPLDMRRTSAPIRPSVVNHKKGAASMPHSTIPSPSSSRKNSRPSLRRSRSGTASLRASHNESDSLSERSRLPSEIPLPTPPVGLAAMRKATSQSSPKPESQYANQSVPEPKAYVVLPSELQVQSPVSSPQINSEGFEEINLPLDPSDASLSTPTSRLVSVSSKKLLDKETELTPIPTNQTSDVVA